MLIFYCEIPLEGGFEVLHQMKENRLVHGRRVSSCSGWNLFKSLEGQQIRCWECSCKADRWIADKGRYDLKSPPVLNLYGTREGCTVLINRDHVIPKSLGGTDAIENLRPACEVCNGLRGNRITQEDLDFRAANPQLVSQARLAHGRAKAQKAAKRQPNKNERAKIMEPFELIDAASTALVDK